MTFPTHYIVLHRSCGNRPGIAAAQAAHAAAESIQTLPVPADTFVCVLRADTSEEIEKLSTVLRDADIFHTVIREPDEPYNGAAVALGVEPTERERVRSFLAHLKVF